MRRVALCFIIGACASPAEPPSTTVPRDVWQPFGSVEVSNGALAIDGDNVWFIAQQDRDTAQGSLFLTKVTPHGETLVPPTNVDGPGPQYYGRSSLAVTSSGVVVGFERAESLPDEGDHPFVRAFDHDGVPVSPAPTRVPVVIGGSAISNMEGLALTPAPDGHTRMLTAVSSTTNELALVDLDATGTPTGTLIAAGTPDEGVRSMTTATLGDGSTLIAWDHGGYQSCTGGGTPMRTMTAVVNPTWSVSTPASLGEQPDREETGPVVASRDGAAYIAWIELADTQTMWLAPYAATNTAVAINDAQEIVLADAAHGALVWGNGNSMLYVQPFENTGNGLTLGDLHAYPPVTSDPEIYVSLVGAASLGGTRYLLAWNEQRLDNTAPTRLYATVVDLADPAPPAMPDRGTPRLATRPCI